MARGNARGRTSFRGRFPAGSGGSYGGSGILYGGHYLRRVTERMGNGDSVTPSNRGNRNQSYSQGIFGRGGDSSSYYYEKAGRSSYGVYSGYSRFHRRGARPYRGRYMSLQQQRVYNGKGIGRPNAPRFPSFRNRSGGDFKGSYSSRGSRGSFRPYRGRGGRGGRGGGRGRRNFNSQEALDTELDQYMGDDSVKGRLDAQLDNYFSSSAVEDSNEMKQDGDIAMDESGGL